MKASVAAKVSSLSGVALIGTGELICSDFFCAVVCVGLVRPCFPVVPIATFNQSLMFWFHLFRTASRSEALRVPSRRRKIVFSAVIIRPRRTTDGLKQSGGSPVVENDIQRSCVEHR